MPNANEDTSTAFCLEQVARKQVSRTPRNVASSKMEGSEKTTPQDLGGNSFTTVSAREVASNLQGCAQSSLGSSSHFLKASRSFLHI